MISKYYFFDKQIDLIKNATDEINKGNYTYKIYTDSKIQKNSDLEYIIENINKISEQFSDLENLQNSFLSNVSHELKTPLTVIKNYANLLENENLNSEERKIYCKIISDTISKLNSLVENILKLMKGKSLFYMHQHIGLTMRWINIILIITSYSNLWKKHLDTNGKLKLFTKKVNFLQLNTMYLAESLLQKMQQ